MMKNILILCLIVLTLCTIEKQKYSSHDILHDFSR